MSAVDVHCSLPGALISSTVSGWRGNRRPAGKISAASPNSLDILLRKVASVGFPGSAEGEPPRKHCRKAGNGVQNTVNQRIEGDKLMGMPGPLEMMIILAILASLGLPVLIVILLFATGKLRSHKPQPAPCSSCGGWTVPGTRYCPHCGKPLSEPPGQ
jgi:hypothetical protein